MRRSCKYKAYEVKLIQLLFVIMILAWQTLPIWIQRQSTIGRIETIEVLEVYYSLKLALAINSVVKYVIDFLFVRKCWEVSLAVPIRILLQMQGGFLKNFKEDSFANPCSARKCLVDSLILGEYLWESNEDLFLNTSWKNSLRNPGRIRSQIQREFVRELMETSFGNSDRISSWIQRACVRKS